MTEVLECEAYLNDENGLPRILPAAEIRRFSREAFRGYCARNGVYIYPTTELVKWVIDQGVELEIGSGNGVLAAACGIKATDNYSQSMSFKAGSKPLQEFHKQSMLSRMANMQMPTPYGKNVIEVDGLEAVKRFKPSVVLGCSVTHKSPKSGGHGYIFGVKESNILSRTKKYIMVGNEVTFRDKPILELPHETVKIDGLVTRYQFEDKDCAFIWTTN